MRLSNLLDYGDLFCNISNTRKRVSSDIHVSSDIERLRSKLKKRGAAEKNIETTVAVVIFFVFF